MAAGRFHSDRTQPDIPVSVHSVGSLVRPNYHVPVTEARAILHVDMDAFFAAIEQRDNPELRGKPIIVGHDGPRGVVTTASYEARPYGCRSAMPVAVAKRLCPDVIIVPVRGRRYREVSRQVFAIFHEFTPLVQPLSVDEAFLDVTGCVRLFGPPDEIARSIKRRIAADTELTCSIGIAPNKFIAKLASDENKPDGLTVVPADGVDAFLAPLPIERMWGVGAAGAKRMHELGVRTFAHLAMLDDEVIARRLGKAALRLKALARGEDERSVTPDSGAKSISQERTFGEDIAERETVRQILFAQAEQVAWRLRRAGLFARTVNVKIRYGDFETITRAQTLDEPTHQTSPITSAACDLFDRWAADSFRPVRLIGAGVSNLDQVVEQGLFEHPEDRRAEAVDAAADAVRDRYGLHSISRAAALRAEEPSD